MRVAIYARISEANDRLGVSRQVKLCRERAEREGWEVVREYVDNNISAYLPGKRREAYESLLADIASDGLGAVLVYHVDRLFRQDKERLRFYEVCLAANVRKVVSVDGQDVDLNTADGRRLFRDLGSAAEYESDRKSERVRRKIAELRSEGKLVRQPSYGYRAKDAPDGSGKVSVVYEPEAKNIRRAAQALLNGASLTSLSDSLPFDAKYLGQFFRRPHPGILSESDTRRIVRELDSRPTVPRKPSGSPYVLTGYLRCGLCGKGMSGRPDRGRRGYICRATGRVHLSVVAQPLEEYVLVEAQRRRLTAPVGLLDPSAPLVAEREAVERKLEELGERFGDISETAFRAAERKLTRELERIDRELDNITPRGTVTVTPIPGGGEDWDLLVGMPKIREWLDTFVDSIAVKPAKGPRAFDPARVSIRWRQGVEVWR